MFRQKRQPQPQHDQLEETRRPRRLRRFWRSTRGSAAIEFSMIAPAFFAFLFPMFEIGITFAADAVLQNAVNDAARQIRTGAVQTSGLTAAEFRQMVCEELTIPLTCDDALLKIDVRTGTNFGQSLNAQGQFRDDYRFTPGGPGDVVVVRALYAWEPLTPFLGSFMDAMKDANGNGKAILQATAAFRNEPYDGSIN
jgi:Flp pilus assembly protein TadG